MTTYLTPVFRIAYIDKGTPLVELADTSRAAAETVEAALVRGGIAPPAAQDLAQLAGRVNRLETTGPVIVTTPGLAATHTAPGPSTVHPTTTVDPAKLISAGAGALVLLDATVLLDTAGGAATQRDLQIVSPALSATVLTTTSRAWSGRNTLQATFVDLIGPGMPARSYSTRLANGTGANAISYADTTSNRLIATVLPYYI